MHLHEATGQGKKRIPCPIDPRHSVVEEDLEKHLQKCAALQHQRNQESDPTFSRDFNRDMNCTLSLPKDSLFARHFTNSLTGDSRSEQRTEFASSLGSSQLLKLINKVIDQLNKLSELELDYIVPEEANAFLESDGKRPFNVKHALQRASIVGHMMKAGVFTRQTPIVVEFGAGKAYLSSMVVDCTNAHSLILLDNQSFKFKAERSMKIRQDLIIRRLRVDLKDFDIAKLPELQDDGSGSTPWVACGKHLCGASTDFTLNTCIHAFQSQSIACQRDSCFKGELKGIFVTTCCHHRCDWESYVAKEQFRSFGFSPEEFELVSWMTGWALCEQQTNEVSTEKQVEFNLKDQRFHDDSYYFWRTYPKEFRIEIGKKCKRLIDEGRRLWLATNTSLNTNLKLYVPNDVSPENKILVAIPQ
eukprot:g1621.t1